MKITIQKDKILHFVVNFFFALLGTYGVSFGLGASLGKEYGDSKAFGNKWDWYDIVADCLGLIVGFGVNRCLTLIFS